MTKTHVQVWLDGQPVWATFCPDTNAIEAGVDGFSEHGFPVQNVDVQASDIKCSESTVTGHLAKPVQADFQFSGSIQQLIECLVAAKTMLGAIPDLVIQQQH